MIFFFAYALLRSEIERGGHAANDDGQDLNPGGGVQD